MLLLDALRKRGMGGCVEQEMGGGDAIWVFCFSSLFSSPFHTAGCTQDRKGGDDGVWRMLGPLLGAVKGDCSSGKEEEEKRIPHLLHFVIALGITTHKDPHRTQ